MSYTHTYTHAPTHAHTHSVRRTHTHAHPHTHTHPHTRTHTHTYPYTAVHSGTNVCLSHVGEVLQHFDHVDEPVSTVHEHRVIVLHCLTRDSL